MRRLYLTLLLPLLLSVSTVELYAQQGRGLFFSAFGTDAPVSYGRFTKYQVFYFDIPKSEERPVYLRIFDVDAGGQYDEKHGRFNTSTRFMIVGGKSAGKVYQGSRLLLETRPEYQADDILYDQQFGYDRRLDGKWFNLRDLPLDAGFEADSGFVRFALIVESLEGDDSNFFDLALSYSKSRKEPVAEARSFTYFLSFRIPSLDLYGWDEFQGQIPLHTKGESIIKLYTFDMDDVPISASVPYQGTLRLYSSGDGDWVENEVAISKPSKDRMVGLNFFGRDFNNTFGFYFTNFEGKGMPIYLPILDYEKPSFKEPTIDYTWAYDALQCSTVTFSIDESKFGDLKEAKITWELDSTVINTSRFTHNFDTTGYHSFTLQVQGLIDNEPRVYELVDSVFINRQPLAWAGGNRVAVPGDYIAFDGTVSEDFDGKITEYVWDLGDGTEREGARIDHIYSEPGNYQVTLRVKDDAETPCSENLASILVKVNAAPQPNIDGPFQVQLGEVFTLDATQSIDPDGRIVDYIWEVGDTVLTGPRIQYAMSSATNIPVRLKVRDDSDALNSEAEIMWSININQPPVAVAGEDKVVSPNRPATFNASRSYDSDGRVSTYLWDFGGGETMEGQVVQYAFSEPGTYEVSLKVIDDSGRAESTDNLTVTVNAPPQPVISGETLFPDGRVTLSAENSIDRDGTITNYNWDLGDGRTMSGENVNFTYAKPGRYKVKLTVADDSKTYSSTQSVEKEIVVNAPPVAIAKGSRRAATNEEVVFEAFDSYDLDGTIQLYEWDFGDGTRGSGVNVFHRYASPGTYQVQLTVYDDTGLANAYSLGYTEVKVNAAPELVLQGPKRVAPGDVFEINLSASSDSDKEKLSYFWNTDGKWERGTAKRSFRASDKLDTIGVAIDDGQRLSNSRTESFFVVPMNLSPIAVAEPKNYRTTDNIIVFSASNSSDPDGDELRYYWDFGDGKSAEGAVVIHNYQYGGSFVSKLTVDDQRGLDNSLAYDSAQVFINRPPEAFFELPFAVCVNDTFSFDATYTHDPDGNDMTFEWTFGDGSSAQSRRGKHVFTQEGTYQVVLTVDDQEGMNNSRASFAQSVNVVGAPVAEAGPDIIACVDEMIQFDAGRSQAADEVVNEYLWDFGDGNVALGMTPTNLYREPGTYKVKLTIRGTELGSCSNGDTDELTVTVVPKPVARFAIPEIIASGDSLKLDPSPSVSEGYEITSLLWTVGDSISIEWNKQRVQDEAGFSSEEWKGVIVDKNGTRPIQKTNDGPVPITNLIPPDGEFEIKLEIGVNSQGNCESAEGFRFISVVPKPKLMVEEVPTLVPFVKHSFSASEASGNSNSFSDIIWDFGDGTKADGLFARHAYSKPGNYLLKVFARFGPDADENLVVAEKEVIVNASPEADFTAPRIAYPSAELTFDASGSFDADGRIISYEWTFSDGQKLDGEVVKRRFEREGVFSVTLKVADDSQVSNASASITKTIRVEEKPSISWSGTTTYCPNEEFDIIKAFDLEAEDSSNVSLTIGNQAVSWKQARSQKFSFPGNYQIGIEVRNPALEEGGTIRSNQAITINGAPEVYAEVPREIIIGPANSFAVFDAQNSFDPNGDRINVYWDMGDGTKKVGKVVRHQYENAGNYTVTLTIRDTVNSECSESTKTYQVRVRKE